jgi:cell division protein ZapA
MNQLEVQIMGQSYLLGCPEGGEARLREAVQRVDEAMCKIRDANKVRARDRIAVLAALNLAFDLSDKAAPAPAEARGADTDLQAPVPDQMHSAVLHALLAQLDDALNEDGQLL